MGKKNIFLSDLSHVTENGLASEFMPYGIGCIKSYFKEHAKNRDEFDISLFKHPKLFLKSFLEKKPSIVGFSNYCWNSDLSHIFALEIKKLYPHILVVFGGPNYPLDNQGREKWLKSHEAVDVYIVGEGEETFSKLTDLWEKTGNIDDLKRIGIEGCHSLVEGNFFNPKDEIPRLSSLNSYPSPYVKGYMDEFLANDKFIPMTESNRGCPYPCTFCDKGSFQWSKITKLDSLELFEEEIHYIAQNTRCKILSLADNNFGLLPRDIELAKILRNSHENFDYPYEMIGTTNKNYSEVTAKCIEILKGIFPVTVSVQSMDPEVLKNIKRTNLPLDKLMMYAKEGEGKGAISRSETILCLPGDSKEKHIQGILELIDAKITYILPYTLILLDGTELGTEEEKERWAMKTKFRLNHRCFGSYEFGEKILRSAEIEEVVVALDTLSFEEYLETRTFILTTSIFYVDDIIYELNDFLESLGIKPSQLISYIHNEGQHYFTPGLKDLYKSYNYITKNELWDDREVLESLVKSTDKLSELTDKGIGTNVLIKHRAMALIDLMEDIINVAFSCAKDLIGPEYVAMHDKYLRELEKFMVLRRLNILDYTSTDSSACFNYDFNRQINERRTEIPSRLDNPMEISFFNTDRQKSSMESFENSVPGKMRLIMRVHLPHLFRGTLEVVS